jgi:hypothetical protein
MRKRTEAEEQEDEEDVWPWLRPAVELRKSATFKTRRAAIVEEAVSLARTRPKRQRTGEDLRAIIHGCIGVMPPDNPDAAGNAKNPDWWMWYVLVGEADAIRRDVSKKLKAADIHD